MTFYIIAFKDQEDVFHNARTKTDDLDDNSSGCLFPSREVAEQYIEDYLSTRYTVAEIKLLSLRDGIVVTSGVDVEEWG